MKIPGGKFQGNTLFFQASSINKGYFGSKERVADLVLAEVPRETTFVEPFCGGGSLSYIMKKSGRRVICGDLSYLAYLHGAGLIAQSEKMGELPELEEVESEEGFASINCPKISCDAGWVDGYCLKYQSNSLMLLAMGKVLDSLRAAGRFPTWINQSIANPELKIRLLEKIGRINRDIIPTQTAEARWGPAHELLNSYESFENSILYLDPAWPFADGSSAGSFYQFPATIGDILRQEKGEMGFMGTEEHLEYILGLVASFKAKGGIKALVATQSTNSPKATEVRERLSEFGRTDLVTRLVKGGTHRQGFMEYLIPTTF